MKLLPALPHRITTIFIFTGFLAMGLGSSLNAQSTDTQPTVVAEEPVDDGNEGPNESTLLVDANGSQTSNIDSSKFVPGWLLFTLSLSLLLTGVSLIITFYLYRWRKDIISTGAMVPEEWAGFLKKVVESSNQVAGEQLKILDDHVRLSSQSQGYIADISRHLSDVQKTMLAMQGALDVRDTEIMRHREGYDTAILAKYLSKLIDIMLKAEKLSTKEDVGKKDMNNISLMILDLLEDGGVEPFVPQVHVDFTELGDAIDLHKSHIETNNPDMHGKIAEVIANGFRMVSGEHSRVLKSSVVQIYTSKTGLKS